MASETLKKGMLDTIFYTLGKLVVGLTGLLSIKLFTNLFAPDIYGDFVLVNTTVNVLVMILFGWLIHSSFRFFGDYLRVEERGSFYATLFFCSLTVGAIGLGGGLVLLQALGWPLSPLLLGGALFFVTQGLSMVLFNVARAMGLSKLYSLLLMLHSCAKLAAIYGLTVYGGMGVESIFYGGIIMDALAVIAIAVRTNLLANLLRGSFSTSILRRFFHYGYPLMGVSIATWVLSASDKYIIKLFRDSAEVGIYAIGYSLVAVAFTLLNTSLMLGMYPVLLKTWQEQGKEATEEMMGRLLRYYLLIAVPAWAGLTLLAQPILTVLAAPEYLSGHVIISWVALGLVFQGLTEYVTKVWELQENTKIILVLMALVAVVNVVLNLILVPSYGFLAAAITTAVSYLLYLLLAAIFSRRLFKWRISLRSLARIAIATLIMTLIFKGFASIIVSNGLQLVLGVPFGALVYFAALALLGEISAELAQIKALIKRRLAR